jgi:DNA-binding NarL/FixJ family response regulator
VAFVVATVRAGEPCPDAITSLWRGDGAPRIELTELDDEAVRALVRSALAGPVEEAAMSWVLEVSDGNPLFVRELVRGALEAGSLINAGGLWRLHGRPAASRSLIDLVSERMADLSLGEREVIELLAMGEPLAVAELARLVPEEALLAAEAHGLLTVSGDAVRLAHPLYGEAIRGALPPLRARAVGLRVVDALERRRPFGPDEALRVARLRLDAGMALPGELTLEAARAANRAGDPELGGQLAELAMTDGDALSAAMLLAQSHTMRNRHAEAETVLAGVESLGRGHAADSDYVKQRLWGLHWGLRDPPAAAALVDRVSDWADDERWRSFIERIGMVYRVMANGFGDPGDAEALATDTRIPDEPRRLAGVMHRMSMLLAGDGDAAAEAAFAVRPAVPLRDFADAAALSSMVPILLDSGNAWAEFSAYAEQMMRDAVRVNDGLAAAMASFALARLNMLRGRYRDATRWVAESESHLERYDPYNAIIYLKVLRVGIALFTADFDGMTAAIERLREWTAVHEPMPAQRVAIRRAEGWALWMRNRGEAGRQMLAEAEALAATEPGLAPQLAYEALRAGAPAAAALEAMADSCRSRLVTAYAAHARAKADHDGAALLIAAEEMADIGALRYAVEAASDAAAAFVAAGRADSARRAAARARELHVPGQGGELPAIDGLDGTATELTAREAQLIELASHGLSNAEIADRLVISVRTVETHIYRGMQKLGVNDRRALAGRTVERPAARLRPASRP